MYEQEIGSQVTQDSLDLADLLFSAKIDYLKIATAGKTTLPWLSGTPRWSRKEHYTSLTIHDATPEDTQALIACAGIGDAKILEFEVAIDARPRPAVADKAAMLERFMIEVTALKLNPDVKSGINKNFRAFYRHVGSVGRVAPFNKRLPKATDQQLHGGRHDPSQVKAYYKRRDMGQEIATTARVARTEVRLATSALHDRGLFTLTDLFGFRFRKELMPFLTHVRGVRRRSSARAKLKGPHAEQVAKYHAANDAQLFTQAGAGAFLEGGLGQGDRVVFLRDVEINNRIGQALTRLEGSFAACEFVRFETGTA